MRIKTLIILICLGFLFGTANTFAETFSGYFNDSTNSALVGSDLGSALFGDDGEIANNVALYPLSIPVSGLVTFESEGYAAGGAEPYFSLFLGNGTAATFLDSNYSISDIDFIITRFMNTGSYMIAMGVWENMTFAENNPDSNPTLADGFIQVGDPGRLGNYYYELDVTGPVQAVPEPTALLLTVLGLVGLAGFRKKSA
jgi:hypothetical protein